LTTGDKDSPKAAMDGVAAIEAGKGKQHDNIVWRREEG